MQYCLAIRIQKLCLYFAVSAILVMGLHARSLQAQETHPHNYGALPPEKSVAPRVLRAQELQALPASVDLTPWTVPVGDQGSLGSCVAWTITHAMIGWYAMRMNGLIPTAFAPMYMYSQLHQPEPPGGMYTLQGFQLAYFQGVDTEADYTQGDYDYTDRPTAAEVANASRYKIASFMTLFANAYAIGIGVNGQTAIQNALAANQPVAIGMNVRTGFEYLGYGQIDTDSTSYIYGTHEVLAVGYNANGLVIQNSWGTGWGTNGFGTLAWNVVQQDVFEAHTISGLLTDEIFANGFQTSAP